MAQAGETVGDVGQSRAGGRPRDSALDEAIILATRERLVKDGYSRIRARARTSSTAKDHPFREFPVAHVKG
jgi:hypothetical protein